MKKLTQQEKDYKKSCELWIEGQESLIDELILSQGFMIQNIKNFKKQLKQHKKRIAHEVGQLRTFKEKHK
jgi:hypothetical protein